MIILSCGHEVSDFDHALAVTVKAVDRCGDKALSYAIVCGACEDQHRQQGSIFDTESAGLEWLAHPEW